MNHFSWNVLLFSLVLLVVSCNRDEAEVGDSEREEIVEKIDFAGVQKRSLAELLKNVQAIPLELTNNSEMINPTKIITRSGKLYILDVGLNAVMVFDKSGMFVKKIANHGDGPGTINLLVDFAFNDHSGEVELLSPRAKIVGYDEQTDEYRDVFNMSDELMPVYGFSLLSEDVIVFFSNLKEYLIYYVSRTKGEVVNRVIENDMIEAIDWHSIHPFTNYNGSIDMLDVYSSIIYEVDAEGATVRRRFDFGKNQFVIKEEYKEEIKEGADLFKLLTEQKAVYPVSKFHEDDENIVIFTLYAGAHRKIFVKNKKSGKWAVTGLDNMGYVNLSLAKLEGRHLGVFRQVDDKVVSIVNELIGDDSPPIEIDSKFESNPLVISYEYR